MGVIALDWGRWPLSRSMPLIELEAKLTAKGVPFLRDFCFQRQEWLFIVNGELVARGGALGLLEWDVQAWWARNHAKPGP